MAAFLDEDGYIDQRICRFYLQGTCNSGNSCRFLHCKELAKTKITWACIRYLSSQGCDYGMGCKFDHPEWAKGLFLLPKICGQYRHEKDGDKCADPECKFLHFTEKEHETYIKDRVIPERFRRKRNNQSYQYSSDEEDQEQGDQGDQGDQGSRSDQGSRGDQGARSHQGSKDRTRDGSSRTNYTDGKRGRSPKRNRSRSPKPSRADSPGSNRNRSRSPLNRGKKEDSPDSSEKRVQKQKRTIRELKAEIDNVHKDNKHLQHQLSDHKRFHDSDQVLINDLMRARDKLEDEVRRLNIEKVDLTKQIGDLFSDNKVIVEENQRLRGLLQSQEGQPRLHTTPAIGQSTYPESFSSTTNHPPLFQQGNWN